MAVIATHLPRDASNGGTTFHDRGGLQSALLAAYRWGMPEVDPDDDTIWRWVVFQRRFDPARREHRDVPVAAYDNAAEFERELERYSAGVQEEGNDTGRGTRHPVVSGRVLHPGYRDAKARGHLVRRAIEHGVDPRRLLAGGPLPSNMAVFGVDDDGNSFQFGGGQPPEPPGRLRRFWRLCGLLCLPTGARHRPRRQSPGRLRRRLAHQPR